MMSRMMSHSIIEGLRRANRNLRTGLTGLQAERAGSVIEPGNLTNLLAELLSAGDCLRRMPAGSTRDAELEQEISEYRQNLEQLARILPSVHGRLLAERARLESVRVRLSAAEAWARASKNTL
jgi:hypothetical protein